MQQAVEIALLHTLGCLHSFCMKLGRLMVAAGCGDCVATNVHMNSPVGCSFQGKHGTAGQADLMQT